MMVEQHTTRALLAAILLLAAFLLTTSVGAPPMALAQEGTHDVDAALNSPVVDDPPEGEVDTATADQPSINIFELVLQGGKLMIPIGLMSLLVVAFGVERALALRRSKIMPPELIDALGSSSQEGSFDPRKAYRLCQQYPSTAAVVIRSMLLKVGRPHSEVEHAVAEASEREAARLYSNVRTLTLAAAITPLMGLLGTVWGMIQAFFATANMPTGVNKAEQLADGIYVALVTTAAGLAVAIPAAVLAHWFEGRIQGLLREIDDLLFNLLPQVEQFEGKLRVSRRHISKDSIAAPENGATSESAAEPRAPAPTAK